MKRRVAPSVKRNEIITLEKKPTYIYELEKVYNKLLTWDKSNFKYGFTLSYKDNIEGSASSVERIFAQRVTGAEVFKKAYQDCLGITSPRSILVYEYKGIGRASKLISEFPIIIRIIEDAKAPETTVSVTRQIQPSANEVATNTMLGSLLGGFGIDIEGGGANSQLGAVLTVQRELFAKESLIGSLQAEVNRLTSDLRRNENDSEARLNKIRNEQSELVSEINSLEQDLEESETEIEELKSQIESLEGDNANHQKNSTLQKAGIGALTQIAFGLVKSSPKIKGLLGIDDEILGSLSGFMGIEAPTEPEQPSAPRRIIEQEEELTPEEKERREVIALLAKELTENWNLTDDIVRLLEISTLIVGNQIAQNQIINALKASNQKQALKTKEVETAQ